MNAIYIKITAMMLILVSAALLSCSDSNDPALTATYSGTALLNFTGDSTFTFMGTTNNVRLVTNNGMELLPLTLTNTGGQTLLIGVNDPSKITARTYDISNVAREGYVTISILDDQYNNRSGTITITTLNNTEIKGEINAGLNAIFSFNDDLIVQGTFELTAN